MVSQKLANLIAAMRERAAQDDVFCPTEIAQGASYLEAILPLVEAMEGQPVPAHLRGQQTMPYLIQGGAA